MGLDHWVAASSEVWVFGMVHERLGMEALGAWTWMHCMDGSISWGSSLIMKIRTHEE